MRGRARDLPPDRERAGGGARARHRPPRSQARQHLPAVPAGRAPAEPTSSCSTSGSPSCKATARPANQTRTGQLLGTPLYMSPEQCRGARLVDSRTDIYSLGCIMFEIFCGRPPFVEPGLGDLMIAQVTQPPPDPVQFSPGLPPAIRQLLLRCLEKEPADRPTVKVLLATLDAAGAREVVRLKTPVQTAGLTTPVAPVRSPIEETTPAPSASMATPANRPARLSGRSARHAWRGGVAAPGRRPIPGDPASDDAGRPGDRGGRPACGPQAPEADRARHIGAGGCGGPCRRCPAPAGPRRARARGRRGGHGARAGGGAHSSRARRGGADARAASPARDGGHHADRGAGRGNHSPRWPAGLRSRRRSARWRDAPDHSRGGGA